ncbi:hypothetical protein KC872_00375, partial [Candidatus Kaiserbacteria bacterium]|nr:hypothetical protein [Candidatus Kaiserbacteria bacterium]
FCQECMVWTAWVISVLIGSLAVAISVFVVTHHQYALYEATHENFLTFMVEVLPYVWLIAFAVMVYVAVFNLRHTKHGYRYSITMILSSSIILSFAGGSALQYFGLGYQIDNILGYQMSMYMSQDKLERKMWQAPEEGRLVGKQVAKTVASTTIVIFEDMMGDRWQMNISELSDLDMEHLASGQTVRLLGEATNSEFKIFHACGAFPWMVNVSVDEMSKERQIFVEQLYTHMKKEEQRLALIEEMEKESDQDAMPIFRSVCANIAAARRMPARQ